MKEHCSNEQKFTDAQELINDMAKYKTLTYDGTHVNEDGTISLLVQMYFESASYDKVNGFLFQDANEEAALNLYNKFVQATKRCPLLSEDDYSLEFEGGMVVCIGTLS